MNNCKKKGKEKDIHSYLKNNIRCLRRWQKLYCAAFCIGFGVFGILGLNMDLRPKISLLEKRVLAKLPQVSFSGIWARWINLFFTMFPSITTTTRS